MYVFIKVVMKDLSIHILTRRRHARHYNADEMCAKVKNSEMQEYTRRGEEDLEENIQAVNRGGKTKD